MPLGHQGPVVQKNFVTNLALVYFGVNSFELSPVDFAKIV
jgi:hypothetical protein